MSTEASAVRTYPARVTTMNRRAFFASLAAIPFVGRLLPRTKPDSLRGDTIVAQHSVCYGLQFAMDLSEFSEHVLEPHVRCLVNNIDLAAHRLNARRWRAARSGTQSLRRRGLRLVVVPVEICT